MNTKDLKDIAFGLLDRTGAGSSPNGQSHQDSLTSSAVRGAVVGALEGLAEMAGKKIDKSEVELRIIRPIHQEEVIDVEEEIDTPTLERAIYKQELPPT